MREALLQSLQGVSIFKGLPLALIGGLADAMTEAPYSKDEYVFDQVRYCRYCRRDCRRY